MHYTCVGTDKIRVEHLPILMQPQTTESDFSTPRVLLIDDDASVRRNISAFLSDSGFSILEAVNGSDGMSVYEAESPDLVLCDLRMPDVDGLDVIKRVTSEGSNTPVIVISGFGEMNDVVQALRLGAADYLIKPIKDLEVLEHSVRRGLKQAALIAENQQYSQQLESTNLQLRHSLDLLRMDQQAGRLVQTRLLPNTPFHVNNIVCKHKIVPSLYLSGDFVDYWQTEDEQLIFYIADVSGHGASSAFVTVLLKYMARDITRRQYRKYGEISTSAILTRLNAEMSQANLQKHVTAFVGLINPKLGVLSYSAAGHYPMPIIGSVEGFELLEERSFPVGIQQQANYEEKTLAIKPGFTMNLFSDGVLELIDAKDLAEKEKILVELVTQSNGDFHAVYDRLQLDSVADAPDDVALLTIAVDE